MKEMKQQKAKLENSAKEQDDRITQLKVCTHMHYISFGVFLEILCAYIHMKFVVESQVKYMQ